MAVLVRQYDGSMGTVWIQRNGPNTAVELLECADIGDIVQPRPGVETRYRNAPRRVGEYEVRAQVRTVPDQATTTITTWLESSRNVLERVGNLPIGIYALTARCRKGDYYDWERIIQIQDALVSARTVSNFAQREGTDSTEQSWDISYAKAEDILPLRVVLQLTAAATHAYGIRFYNDTQGPPCGDAMDVCTLGILVTNGAVGAPADVYYTTNGGNTWSAAAANPFGNAEDILASCVVRTANGYRWIVGRSTADAGNPAEIAYSDDSGASWTNVNIGSTNGEYFPGWNCICAADDFTIYAVTSGGKVYQSVDSGITWDELTDLGANAMWAAHFITPYIGAVAGAANSIYYTTNGGTSWVTVTGPAAEAANTVRTIWMIDSSYWWAGYSSGNLYYTTDAGATWTERAIDGFVGATATAVNDVRFLDPYNGFATVQWGTRRAGILRTFDGGYTWTLYAHPSTFDNTPTVYGLTQIALCDPNRVFAATGLVSAVSGATQLVE